MTEQAHPDRSAGSEHVNRADQRELFAELNRLRAAHPILRQALEHIRDTAYGETWRVANEALRDADHETGRVDARAELAKRGIHA